MTTDDSLQSMAAFVGFAGYVYEIMSNSTCNLDFVFGIILLKHSSDIHVRMQLHLLHLCCGIPQLWKLKPAPTREA